MNELEYIRSSILAQLDDTAFGEWGHRGSKHSTLHVGGRRA